MMGALPKFESIIEEGMLAGFAEGAVDMAAVAFSVEGTYRMFE